MAETKTSVAANPKTGALEEQPHGGQLRRGNPGNKGGKGAVPKTLRHLCHKRFVKHLPKLDRALKKESLKESDLISALNLFAKYGSDAAMPVPELRKRLQRQNEIIREMFDTETAERIIHVIRGVWVAG